MSRLSLFLDFDGTLIDLADHPDSVSIPKQLPATLGRLEGKLDGAMALVSGRNIWSLDEQLFSYRGPAIGVHGAEMRQSGASSLQFVSSPISNGSKDTIASILQRYPDTFMENKGIAIAVHGRSETTLTRALADELATVCRQLCPGWHCIRGRRVIEIKPLAVDKGTGLNWLMSQMPFVETVPVVMGDDITDLDMFAAAKLLGGLTISIGERIVGYGDCHLRSPNAVIKLIEKWISFDIDAGLAKVEEMARQLRFA